MSTSTEKKEPTAEELWLQSQPAAEACTFLLNLAIDNALAGSLAGALQALGRGMTICRDEMIETARLSRVDPKGIRDAFRKRAASLKAIIAAIEEQENAVRAAAAGANPAAGESVSAGGLILPGPGSAATPVR